MMSQVFASAPTLPRTPEPHHRHSHHGPRKSSKCFARPTRLVLQDSHAFPGILAVSSCRATVVFGPRPAELSTRVSVALSPATRRLWNSPLHRRSAVYGPLGSVLPILSSMARTIRVTRGSAPSGRLGSVLDILARQRGSGEPAMSSVTVVGLSWARWDTGATAHKLSTACMNTNCRDRKYETYGAIGDEYRAAWINASLFT